ncbi:MFS transporter [Chloroflexota bacterium]
MNAGVYFYGFGALFDSLIGEFRCTRAMLLESGVLGPIDGLLVDKFGPRKVMLVGVLLMSVGFVVLSLVSSITEFYLVFVLMVALGSGLGFTTPLMTAVGNWFVRRQGIAFGLASAGVGLGGLLIPLLSWIIAQHGWRTAVLVGGITIFAIATPIALLMRHKPEQYGYVPDGEASPMKEERQTGEQADFTAREALKTRAFWLLSITFAIRLMVTGAVPVHIMPFLLDSGFPRGIAAAALGSIAIISVPGRLGYSWLGDRFEKRYVIAGLLLLLGGSLVLLCYVESVWQLFIFLGLYAPAYGGLAALMQAIRGEYFGRRAFGTIMGFMAMVIMLGTITGPIFAGYVWDITGSYRLAFLTFAVATVVAMGLILGVKPPVKKEG